MKKIDSRVPRAFTAAFPHTLPILAGFLFLGMTYGVHMTTSGHPFWFPDRPTPRYVLFLGKALPPAVFGMLVVYCLKSVNLLAAPNGLPEAIALVVVIALHLWQRKMMLSIAGGTLCYMLLVQFVF